jgi:metallo-beta-lactamase class B
MFGRLLAIAALLTAVAGTAFAQPSSDQQAWTETCTDWDEWDDAGPPFKVFGNTWYVGTCGIGAVLVTSDTGHILIDSGTENGARLIATNVEKLGFELTDVEMLLMSHEHHDHSGGMARLKRRTEARLAASPAAAKALESGSPTEEDPQFVGSDPLPKVEVDDVLAPDAVVAIGSLTLRALDTPGHTPGALSWHWQSCEGEVCKSIVYADSLSPVSSDYYRFSDHPEYVQAYRRSLARLAELDCDILLTPHPSASGMRDKLIAGNLSAGPTCRDYAAAIGQRLDARLAEEAAAAQ